MVKFICNKLGRDKGLQGFASEKITPHYQLLQGDELCVALKEKLIEEAIEVQEACNQEEIIAELADVLDVIDGLCKANDISLHKVIVEKETRYQERGGFKAGLFVESIEMDEDNPKVEHFRKLPKKYPEIL